KTIPERFSATSGPSNRIKKVCVDYLRNGKGQTTAAAFSARAPGHGCLHAGVVGAVVRVEIRRAVGVQTAREYLSFESADPWSEYWSTAQTLTVATKLLK
ncbi:hypothetical protein SB749_19075, partial [Brevibacterium sp. SIMBA_078]|uniref:non-homologous end-joining DNA ligase LigD n=1 Tax=Brevibacterium sp. SIMBA_078 TaxID=3085816 RepID=UPI00397C3011